LVRSMVTVGSASTIWVDPDITRSENRTEVIEKIVTVFFTLDCLCY
jgi:hypothetical protein